MKKTSEEGRDGAAQPHDAARSTQPAAPATVSVAYHAGPPEITYYRREWRIGVAQPIPLDDWIAMNDRSDFPEFDFREEP